MQPNSNSSSPHGRVEEILCRVLELFVRSAAVGQALRRQLANVTAFFVRHSRPRGDFREQASATDACVIRSVERADADAGRERGDMGGL
jgi:hypothetical protein